MTHLNSGIVVSATIMPFFIKSHGKWNPISLSQPTDRTSVVSIPRDVQESTEKATLQPEWVLREFLSETEKKGEACVAGNSC